MNNNRLYGQLTYKIEEIKSYWLPQPRLSQQHAALSKQSKWRQKSTRIKMAANLRLCLTPAIPKNTLKVDTYDN